MGLFSNLFNKKKVSDVYSFKEVPATTLAEGDIVTVVNAGKRYSSMKSWFTKYGEDEFLKYFAPETKPLDTSLQYQALMIHPHVTDQSIGVACITDAKTYGQCYLIGITGLSKKDSCNVGNRVRIVNAGALYSTYEAWFTENKLEVLKQFWKKDEKPDTSAVYKVVALAKHSTSDARYSNMVYAIVDEKTESKLYLMAMHGIKKV